MPFNTSKPSSVSFSVKLNVQSPMTLSAISLKAGVISNIPSSVLSSFLIVFVPLVADKSKVALTFLPF